MCVCVCVRVCVIFANTILSLIIYIFANIIHRYTHNSIYIHKAWIVYIYIYIYIYIYREREREREGEAELEM